MSWLPIVNWHELATKEDLKVYATKDDLRVMSAELRIELHQSLASQTRWLAGFNLTLAALVLTVAKLVF